MNTTISIIIPVYNVEKYLEQCLESVVNQTQLFNEVILVNDGSSDNSRRICEKYVSAFEYFRLINQDNKGPSAARNLGMKYATGKYIMFLDSDDYLRDNTAERLRDELRGAERDGILFDARIFCEDGIVSKDNYDRSSAHLDEIQMDGWEYFSKAYPKYYIVSPCFSIYRKEIIDTAHIQFPEGMLYEDNYFWFVFLLHAKNLIHISEMLYQRRCRKDSITTSKYSERKFEDYVKVTLLIWEAILEKKEVLLEKEGEVLLTFINDYCGMNLDNYRTCLEEKIQLTDNAHSLFNHLTEQYVSIVNLLYLGDKSVSLCSLNKILSNAHYINLWCKDNKKDIVRLIHEVTKRQKILYRKLLEKIPLSDKKIKIGIYGTGNHTEGLIQVYEKLVGKITCNVVFLDSFRDNDRYKGRALLHYKRVDDSFHGIVISSYLYEKEMEENIKMINKTVEIYKFYETLTKDVFSEYDIFLRYCET